MKPHLSLTLVALLATFSIFAAAADDVGHVKHHPEAAANQKATKATHRPRPASAAKMDMQKMDTQMKAMQAMHEKMMQAKTPQERQALMDEHMKVMHNGMSMMNSMMGKAATGKEAMSPKTMQKQTDMMQMMMDMMKERMQASPMQ